MRTKSITAVTIDSEILAEFRNSCKNKSHEIEKMIIAWLSNRETKTNRDKLNKKLNIATLA